MSQPIRAVYKGGQLWLLDPVHVMEGQVIRVLILSEEDRVRAALGGLVVPLAARVGEDVDKKALAWEVEVGFRGPAAAVRPHPRRMSCKVCHSQAVSRPESASSGHLRQCSFGLGQPEGHLHGAVQLDGRAQSGTGLLCSSHLVV